MQTLLFVTGLALFMMGLLTGLGIPAMKNPRMGVSSHLEGHMNGTFLIVLGLVWPYVELSYTWELLAVALLIYGAWANWLATLLAGVWGVGGSMAKIAAPNHVGTGFKENVVRFLFITLSIADIVGLAVVLWGVARP
jgi:hydroxylaminobenzene mutase